MNNNKSSIHIFAYWHDPRWKKFVGASVKIWDMAMNLADRGYNVTLFLPKYGFSKPGLPFVVYEIPMINLPGVRSISYNIFLLWFLISHWRSFRPDIVYLRRTSLVVALPYARFKRARFFFEINDDPFVTRREEGSRWKFRIRSFISKSLDRINIHFADRCLVISDALIRKIERQFPSVNAGKMMVMASGTNTDLMRPLEKKDSCSKIDLDENSLYVGFAGTLLAHQGLNFLVESAPSIIKSFPAVRFLIVGDGPVMKRLQGQVNKKKIGRFFIFTGEIEYDRLPLWINAMDLCVAPYAGDAGLRSPVKIFDYLSCGKPVVASDVPGVTGIFTGAPLMVLVPPESSVLLADAICKILTSPDPSTAERTSAHQWIRERFDRRMNAELLSEEAERLIEK